MGCTSSCPALVGLWLPTDAEGDRGSVWGSGETGEEERASFLECISPRPAVSFFSPLFDEEGAVLSSTLVSVGFTVEWGGFGGVEPDMSIAIGFMAIRSSFYFNYDYGERLIKGGSRRLTQL